MRAEIPMATPEDYVGKRFGYFSITKHLGAGATAEVFICEHLPSRFPYVLRLDVEDDALWDDEPLLPPRNGDFERGGVKFVWDMGNNEKPGWPEMLEMHYQIVDQKDVIPLCSPWHLAHALTAPQVRSLRDAVMPILDGFSLYSDAVGAMVAAATLGGLAQDMFLAKWGKLSGGSHLLALVGSEWENLAGMSDKSRVLDLLARRNDANPEFAENRLLWLCVAATHELISRDDLHATLMCRWFRQNIAIYEIEQFLEVQRALQDADNYYLSNRIDASQQWAQEVLRRLATEPYNPSASPELFVKAESEPPIVSSDWVVLQNPASYERGALVR